ncbi:MAG TPA: glutathione S-transferase family protein [Myxococcota bacterium]|nr:glutathione S-transferase family protein [Myxococcota bacterium]
MSLVVLGNGVSPFVRKVRAFLAEKGQPYQHDPISPFAPPEGWREISPLGRIPALRDGDRIVNDSSVICQYLERRFPSPALYPGDDYEFARALWIEEFMDGGFVPIVGPKLFRALVLVPLLTRKPADDATEAAARKAWDEEAAPLLDHLERTLGDREWFVGERLSIADLTVASPFVNVRHAGYAPERKRWPRLRAFLERTWQRPSFAPLIAEDMPIFGRRAERIQD